MKFKLFLLLLLSAALPSLAQSAGLQGVVLDASTGAPINGAKVTLSSQAIARQSGLSGDFILPNAQAGSDFIIVTCDGYAPLSLEVAIPANGVVQLGEIKLDKANLNADDYFGSIEDLVFDENVLEDEEGNSQSVAALTGANDNLYYSTASYNFGPMYFRYRGYDSRYQ